MPFAHYSHITQFLQKLGVHAIVVFSVLYTLALNTALTRVDRDLFFEQVRYPFIYAPVEVDFMICQIRRWCPIQLIIPLAMYHSHFAETSRYPFRKFVVHSVIAFGLLYAAARNAVADFL